MAVLEATLAKREFVIEYGIEDVRAVKEGRSVVEVPIVARRIVSRVVLDSPDGIEGFREGVIEVEEQAMPLVVPQIDHQRVVIGGVAAGPDEIVKDLQVVDRLQAQGSTGEIHSQEQIGEIVVQERRGVASRHASCGGDVCFVRTASIA